jgi:hypothetical protein
MVQMEGMWANLPSLILLHVLDMLTPYHHGALAKTCVEVNDAYKARMATRRQRLEASVDDTFGPHIVQAMAEILERPFQHPQGNLGPWIMPIGGNANMQPQPGAFPVGTGLHVSYHGIGAAVTTCTVRVIVLGAQTGEMRWIRTIDIGQLDTHHVLNIDFTNPAILGLLLRAATHLNRPGGRVFHLRVSRAQQMNPASNFLGLPGTLMHGVRPADRANGGVFPSIQEVDDLTAGLVHLGVLLGRNNMRMIAKGGDVRLAASCISQ